jgi:hypothetical protein
LSINVKSLLLIAFLTLRLFLTGSAEDAISLQKTNEAWQAHTYLRIGLKIKLPNWKTDVEDQGRRWSLLAYPLVENPVTDVQYRVVISAIKLPEEEHLRIYPKLNTDSTGWINSQHLQTSQMTNAFWIYSRRDVFGSNGFAYFCEGSIKRDANLKPKDVRQLDGDEENLAIEVRRVLDSIEVLTTNSAAKP